MLASDLCLVCCYGVCRELVWAGILPVGVFVLVGLGTGEETRGGGKGGSSRDGEKSGDGELHCCCWGICLLLRDMWFEVVVEVQLLVKL